MSCSSHFSLYWKACSDILPPFYLILTRHIESYEDQNSPFRKAGTTGNTFQVKPEGHQKVQKTTAPEFLTETQVFKIFLLQNSSLFQHCPPSPLRTLRVYRIFLQIDTVLTSEPKSEPICQESAKDILPWRGVCDMDGNSPGGWPHTAPQRVPGERFRSSEFVPFHFQNRRERHEWSPS